MGPLCVSNRAFPAGRLGASKPTRHHDECAFSPVARIFPSMYSYLLWDSLQMMSC